MDANTGSGVTFLCRVCKDIYSCPRSLPCFHSFCESCLVSAWSKYDVMDQNLPRSAKCPLCSDDVLAPNSKISLNDWVRSFPRNLLMETLMKAEKAGNKCDPCLRAAKDKDATYYCQDCRENLCEMCYSYVHWRMVGFNKHNISKNAMHKDKLDINLNCNVHANEKLDVFCVSHQLMCCTICMATEHKRCLEVLSVEETVQSKLADIGSDTVLLNLESVVAKTDAALVFSKKEVKDQEKNYVKFRNAAFSTVDKIISKIQVMHDVFKRKLQETQAKELERLQTARKYLNAFLYTLEEAEKLVTLVSKRGTPRQMFVTASKVNRQLQNQSERLEKMFGTQLDFGVQISEDLEEFSKIESVAQLDEKTVDLSYITEIGDQLKSFEDSMRSDDVLSKPDVDPDKLVAKEIAEYSGEIEHIRDGCLLSDGTVLTTGYREIRSVRDGEMRVLLEIDGDDYVFNKICLGEKNRLFVSTNDNKIIEFTFHEGVLQIIRNIKMEVEFDAFRYFAGKFYCRLHKYGYEYGIAILDEYGKLVRIHDGIEYKGEALALSMDGQQVYFNSSLDVFCRQTADWFTCFDYKQPRGEENFYDEFRGSYLSIDTDKYGNVYGIAEHNNQILQISNSGKSCRDFLLTAEDYSSVCIRFEPNRQRFAVFYISASYEQIGCLMKVYELCVVDDEAEETKNEQDS